MPFCPRLEKRETWGTRGRCRTETTPTYSKGRRSGHPPPRPRGMSSSPQEMPSAIEQNTRHAMEHTCILPHMDGFNPAWWLSVGIAVLLAVAGIHLSNKRKTKAKWVVALTALGCCLVVIGGVGVLIRSSPTTTTLKAVQAREAPAQPEPAAPVRLPQGEKQVAGRHARQQQQSNSGGTNTQVGSVRTGDITTGRVATCKSVPQTVKPHQTAELQKHTTTTAPLSAPSSLAIPEPPQQIPAKISEI
jgi:hypothetical protein